MDAGKASKRKRSHDTGDDNAAAPEHEGPSQKRACQTIKDEPDDDNIISIRSLPVHSADTVSPKTEELLPPPSPSPPPPPRRYWHPAFPDQAVRCKWCQRTDTVIRVPTARANDFNIRRLQFTCIDCGGANRFGGFICWADTGGIYERNMTCDCGLISRADLTRRRLPNRIFFTCALGRCDFRLMTDLFVKDRANLEHRVNKLNIWRRRRQYQSHGRQQSSSPPDMYRLMGYDCGSW